MTQQNPTYFDGRGLDKLAERMMKQEWYQDRVKAMAAQQETPVVYRYPHSMEAQHYLNQ